MRDKCDSSICNNYDIMQFWNRILNQRYYVAYA